MYKLDKLTRLLSLIQGKYNLKDDSEISEALNYSRGYISSIKTNNNITDKFVNKLEWKFAVKKAYLTGESPQPFINDSMVINEPTFSYNTGSQDSEHLAALKTIIAEKNTTINHLNNIIIRLEKELGKKNT